MISVAVEFPFFSRFPFFPGTKTIMPTPTFYLLLPLCRKQYQKAPYDSRLLFCFKSAGEEEEEKEEEEVISSAGESTFSFFMPFHVSSSPSRLGSSPAPPSPNTIRLMAINFFFLLPQVLQQFDRDTEILTVRLCGKFVRKISSQWEVLRAALVLHMARNLKAASNMNNAHIHTVSRSI